MRAAKTRPCELVKARDFTRLVFSPTLARSGFWAQKVQQLRQDPELLMKIGQDDASALMQLRKHAKACGLLLMFAKADGFLFVKGFIPSEEQQRLYLLLREPRTVDELKTKGLQMGLVGELQELQNRGHAQIHRGKWQLTEAGSAALLPGAKQ